MSTPDPSVAAETRGALHLVAAHVLGRRRHEVSGRFGLRASPGGFATPAFGDGPEVIRVTGLSLVREIAGQCATLPIPGSSLRHIAQFAGTDLNRQFAAGNDTPEIGDAERPLELDPAVARQIADWYRLGWQVLDTVLAQMPAQSQPATIQLWPEHFDAGTNVGLPSGERVNLGFSPGDGYEPQPYVYVGPRGPERRGDPSYWNAPFGALLRAADVVISTDPFAACLDFIRTGLAFSSNESNAG